MSSNKKPGEYLLRDISGVEIEQRYKDGYINATKLSNAHKLKTGQRREPSEWLGNQRTKETLNHLSGSTGIPVDLLIQKITTGSNINRGTYIHPKLAVRYGMWLSDDFGFLVEQWVEDWLTTGRNPLADMDRVGLRDSLKDDSRLRMTDQVKEYLEQIRRYDDKKYSGMFFARVHDAINKAVTGETAKQMKNRLSQILNKKIKENELIRDYFPSKTLQWYISMCETSANLMLKKGMHPVSAVEEASELVLPASYTPQPINFVEHIKEVRIRVQGNQPKLFDIDNK